ncbi:hypothetical protein ACFPOD_05100 [Nitratireductor kimnyeongensis]|uniref:Uncharacterized protein n=1 Tax=Nitratireductor kimnyeongensis TaxID=430679 RepID=A0ABW0T5N3_9HYPH|nr:hypothetical protein [Nitratireductor kimnyeongensis]QZZ34540.1 hypothetical protein KW403_12100 [Nitratireductor kimnyeongensis]
MAYATKMTRTGERDMSNRKPYRTAKQKAEAKRTAVRGEDGVYRSGAPVSFHRGGRGNAR